MCVCMHVCVLSHFSHVKHFSTLWIVVSQAPLSMRFSRQEYWSRLPCPPPGDLPDPGIKPASLESSALADWFFTASTKWRVHNVKRQECALFKHLQGRWKTCLRDSEGGEEREAQKYSRRWGLRGSQVLDHVNLESSVNICDVPHKQRESVVS